MVTPIKIYSGDDIDKLYREYAEFLKNNGVPIVFGNPDEPKHATHSMAIVQLYGQAIVDILNGVVPKDFPWSGKKIKELQGSFDKDANNNRLLAVKYPEDKTNFDYTYPELLTKQTTVRLRENGQFGQVYVNQMEESRKILEKAIKTNMFDTRNVGNVYEPLFFDAENKPCFQVYQVQHTGDGNVTLVLVFRSHDYGGAIWANACAISYWFNERVIVPAGGKLDEVVIFSMSAHVYDDSDVIEKLLRYGYMSRFL
jgi:thymidylate synthase